MVEDQRQKITDETIRYQLIKENKFNLTLCFFCFIVFIIGSLILYAINVDDYTFVMVIYYILFLTFGVLMPINYIIFYNRVIKQGNFFVTEEVYVDYSAEPVKWYPNDGILIFDYAFYKKFKRIDMLTESEKSLLEKDKTFYVVRSCFGKHTILRIYNKRSYKYDTCQLKNKTFTSRNYYWILRTNMLKWICSYIS